MPGAATPQILLEAIASAASGSFITNPIPDAPTGTNAASVQGGFPPITMQETLAGGKPPLGQDMNGYLFLISSHTMYVQCGQPYVYSSTLATAIGGYLTGTILGMADKTGLWLNTVNANVSNPDTGGAGWLAVASSGVAAVATGAGGTTTLSAAQWKKGIIVLSGALTSAKVIVLPAIIGQQWLVINTCSGAFALTVKTAAGTGVVVPAGGYASPTGVYCGGANINYTTSPLAIPIDQAPNPNTIAERTNAGYLLATYFNGNAAVENPTVGAVVVQNSAADGYFRKISLTNFIAQAFGFAASLIATNGSFSLLGLTLKWGAASVPAAGGVAVTFTNPFPTACWGTFITINQPSSAGTGLGVPFVYGVSRTGFSSDNTSGSVSTAIFWLAIGK